MTWRDVWTSNAILGAREVAAFQDELRSGSGAALVNAIFDRVREQLKFPHSAPVHPSAGDQRVRRLVFKSYIVVYRIIDDQLVLQVLAVRHQRQRPLEPDELP